MIRDRSYREAVDDLKKDPIIKAMVKEVANLAFRQDQLDDYQTMMTAAAEYISRGGEISTHIGGPIEAIKELLNEQPSQNPDDN